MRNTGLTKCLIGLIAVASLGCVQHDGQLLDAKETQAIRRAQMGPHVEQLERLGSLLREVEPARAIELCGGSLEVRLALMRLQQIDEGERQKLEYVLETTQSLLALLRDTR